MEEENTVIQQQLIETPKAPQRIEPEPSNPCKGGAIFSFLLSVASLFMGFYKMYVYDLGEHYPYEPKNAYVGGDAYNYIINGTYSTAFFVLATGLLVFGIGLLIYGELKLQRTANK